MTSEVSYRVLTLMHHMCRRTTICNWQSNMFAKHSTCMQLDRHVRSKTEIKHIVRAILHLSMHPCARQ